MFTQVLPPAWRDEQHRGDHHHVEQRGPHRRDEKVAARVEHAHEHRRETDQQHVREHHPQQLEHQPRVRVKLPPHQHRRKAQHHHSDYQRRDHHQRGDDRVGRVPHRLVALGFLLVFEQRNECRRESALAEQAAEKVGNLEGVNEGAGDRSVAHEPGVNHHPHHPEQATEQRGPGHGAGGFEHVRQRAAG